MFLVVVVVVVIRLLLLTWLYRSEWFNTCYFSGFRMLFVDL